MTNQTDRLRGAVGNVAIKAPCRVASAAALTLSGEQTINGLACVTGDRVLVKDQADAAENGIYVVDTGDWVRATDFDGAYDCVMGTIVPVYSGLTTYETWAVVVDDPQPGTTDILFELLASDALAAALANTSNTSLGDALLGVKYAALGSAARTQHDVNEETKSSAGFGSKMLTTPGADINAAIAAVNLAGGGLVEIPTGDFQIETSILLMSNVQLVGRGKGATVLIAKTGLSGEVIKQATAISVGSISGITRSGRTATATKNGHGFSNGSLVFISGAAQLGYNGVHYISNVSANTFDFLVEKTTVTPATGTILVYGVTESNLGVHELEIVGNAANTAGNNFGISLHGVDNFEINNVYAHDTYGTCIAVLSGANGRIHARADGAINSSHDGIFLGSSVGGPSGGASYALDIELANCVTNANGQTGIEFVNGKRLSATDCRATRNAVGGLTSSGASEVSIDGGIFEKNTAHGIELYLGGGASDISVQDTINRENGECGIFMVQNDTANPSKRISLVGNICGFNSQVAAGVAYGIAVELLAGTTVDEMIVSDNQCSNNARGISFGTDGTIKNLRFGENFCKGNTLDISMGASVEVASLIRGWNAGLSSSSYQGAYPTTIERTHFWTDNLPQSSGTVVCSDGFGGRGYLVPRAGFIRSMAVKSNANVTAGNATFQLRVNGTINSNFNTSLNTTNPAFLVTEQNVQTTANVLAAGDMITVIATGDGSLLPNGTADFDVVVEIVY